MTGYMATAGEYCAPVVVTGSEAMLVSGRRWSDPSSFVPKLTAWSALVTSDVDSESGSRSDIST